MPLSERLGFLSLIGRKNRHEQQHSTVEKVEHVSSLHSHRYRHSSHASRYESSHQDQSYYHREGNRHEQSTGNIYREEQYGASYSRQYYQHHEAHSHTQSYYPSAVTYERLTPGSNRSSSMSPAQAPMPTYADRLRVASGNILPPVAVLEAGATANSKVNRPTPPPTIEKEFQCSMDAASASEVFIPGLSRKATPQSDGSTPFAVVMDEWLNQLRTPTPDVTLLPSPYDFNRDRPTPIEKNDDDLKRIQDALLPTPPPDIQAKHQETKSEEYVSYTSGRRPLVEDIASLCRDLISQNINREADEKNPFQSTTTRESEARKSPSPEESEDGSRKGKRRKMCMAEGCKNLSRSRGLCKAHGGGRRCSVEGCTRASQSGSLCITHGGGKRCTVEGCEKAAQSRGMCKAHGGGVRCRVEGCTKSSQGDGFCRTHGGGRRCGHSSGCTKWAQRNGMCMAHSEGKYGNSYRGRMARLQERQKSKYDDDE